ncbi:MAG: hypothetical protein IJ646_14350, partial [Clostridia bacterium]|nr:hypothetical protein [Clostridia bacterium]
PGRPLKLLTSLMPGAFVGSWLFDNYITVTLFGARLTVMQYAPLCWAAVGAALLMLAGAAYRRYEVRAR